MFASSQKSGGVAFVQVMRRYDNCSIKLPPREALFYRRENLQRTKMAYRQLTKQAPPTHLADGVCSSHRRQLLRWLFPNIDGSYKLRVMARFSQRLQMQSSDSSASYESKPNARRHVTFILLSVGGRDR